MTSESTRTIFPAKGDGANLLITSLCNQSCPYCFLKGWVTSDPAVAEHMSLSDLDRVIDWLQVMGFDNVKLLGGEPTLHPQFMDIVRRLIERKVHIDCILTNGLAETDLYEMVNGSIETTWLINVNHPSTYSNAQWNRLNNNLEVLKWHEKGSVKRLGIDVNSQKLQLAITFYEPDQDYSYIIDLAKKFGVFFIRYAPSHPSSDLKNEHVDFEKFAIMKSTLLRFFRDCAREDIRPNLECAIPACAFTQKELNYMSLFTENTLFECTPHIDVMPDLSITYCATMKDIIPRYQVGEMQFDETLAHLFRDAVPYKGLVLPRCKGCAMFANAFCQGYCLRYKAEFLNDARRSVSSSGQGRTNERT